MRALRIDEKRMLRVLSSARLQQVEVPICAMLFDDSGRIVEIAHNEVEKSYNPLRHAEVVLLNKVFGREIVDLSKMTLYCNLEPCIMCTACIKEAGVGRIVFGASNPRTGGCGGLYDIARDSRIGPWVEVTPNVLAKEAAFLLSTFFMGVRLD